MKKLMLKRKLTAALGLMLIFCSPLMLTGVFAAEDTGGAVAYTGGTISFYKDFTTLAAYDMTWQMDEAVADYEGNLTVSPNTIRALGIGKQNVSSAGAGSVSYLVEVPEDNVIETLSWTAHGRAYHSTSNDECKNGNCVCDYSVSLSTDGGQSFTKVSTEAIATSGTSVTFYYDLAAAAGEASALIKLSMAGKSWDWVHMTDISIDGTYVPEGYVAPKEAGFEQFYDYTGYAGYSTDWTVHAHAYDTVTISPSAHEGKSSLCSGKQNSTSEGEGYVVYKFTAPDGQLISSLDLLLHGRIFHSVSNAQCLAGDCVCHFRLLAGTDGTNFTPVREIVPYTAGTWGRGYNQDFTAIVRGSKSAYIRIEMSGKSWDWVAIEDIRFTGKYMDENVRMLGSVTLNAGSGGIEAGKNAYVNLTVANKTDAAVETELRFTYPKSRFEFSGAPAAVNVAANGQESVSVPVKVLEGGYGTMLVGLYSKDGELLDSYKLKAYATGAGYYFGDSHHQSEESDGRNTTYEMYDALIKKDASWVITTDHNHKTPGDWTNQTNAAAKIREDNAGLDFISLKGSELTTANNAHMLGYNFSSRQVVLRDSQEVINSVASEGGFTYLAHPFYKNYLFSGMQSDPSKVDALSGFTGVELMNGESMVNKWRDGEGRASIDKVFEYWDRMNIKGEKKYYGTSGSDSHDSVLMGIVGNALYLEELSVAEVTKSMAQGRFYITNGPELRFSLDGKIYGQTVETDASKTAKLSIQAFDPDYPITKVVLYKFRTGADNSALFTEGRDGAEVLYEDAELVNGLHSFEYEKDITVAPGEFYRVEVLTAHSSKNPQEYDLPGFAVANPIFVDKAVESISLSGAPETAVQYGTPFYGDMIVTANFAGGGSKRVYGWYAYGFDSSAAGTCTVTVDYNGHTKTFNMNISEYVPPEPEVPEPYTYKDNYSEYFAYDKDFEEVDGFVRQENLTISPTALTWLAVDAQNVGWDDKVGVLVVKISTDDPAGFYSLVISGHARVLSNENSPARFEIFVSSNDSDYVKIGGLSKTSNGDVYSDFGITVKDEIEGFSDIYVKIEMVSGYWDWVCLRELKVQGALRPPKYAITYELNGGVNNPKNPAEGDFEDIFALYAPTKDGKIFRGWYTDSGFTGTVVTSVSNVTEPVTLYAKWSDGYYIRYVLDGGTNAADNPAEYSADTVLSAASKSGFTFEGWYYDSAFTSEVGTIAADKGDIIVYARFTENPPVDNGSGGCKSGVTPAAGGALALLSGLLVACVLLKVRRRKND